MKDIKGTVGLLWKTANGAIVYPWILWFRSVSKMSSQSRFGAFRDFYLYQRGRIEYKRPRRGRPHCFHSHRAHSISPPLDRSRTLLYLLVANNYSAHLDIYPHLENSLIRFRCTLLISGDFFREKISIHVLLLSAGYICAILPLGKVRMLERNCGGGLDFFSA